MMESIASVALLLLLVPAVVTDVRYHRIPNRLVFAFWLAGPVMHGVLAGWPGVVDSGLGLALAFAVTFPLWMVGWFGAGDVKLVAAVGALVGMELVWPTLGAIALSGMVLALAALLYRGALGRALRRWWASLALSVAGRHQVYITAQGSDADIRLPYAIAIAVGCTAVWLMNVDVLAVLH